MTIHDWEPTVEIRVLKISYKHPKAKQRWWRFNTGGYVFSHLQQRFRRLKPGDFTYQYEWRQLPIVKIDKEWDDDVTDDELRK